MEITEFNKLRKAGWENSYGHLYWGYRPDVRSGFHYSERGLMVLKIGNYFFGFVWGKIKKVNDDYDRGLY